MASTASTTQIVSNNETFTIGQQNGFEIIVREKDGFINATKLVQIINEREHTNKQIKKIVQSVMYRDYKQLLWENFVGQNFTHQLLDYQLDNNFSNHVRGTYVHKELLNIVCMKACVNYLHQVTKIMDKINETVIAEHDADKTQATADQFHIVINTVTDSLSDRITDLNQQVRQLAPRAVPNGKGRTYILIVEEINEDEQLEDQQEDHITIRIRRINRKDLHPAKIERYRRESLLFVDNLSIAMTINEKIKETLSSRQDVKIWSTHYTFPEDQLDFIIDIIQATIKTERAH
ncbi:MAG: hypothetical protein EZS28_041673 [Streblomastix strix]|uniref:KilA-N domain-containing protein n=1 Tax=Streblomastix strix TaxID=222440 RepID=A0A5J4TYT1_9EUKA|nr:MAG: hypothetical protein EZS28_041673 [Streblomastix strix]